jgi:RNA polymerase sigma-70 factor (ECF subfamily)
VSAMVMDPPSKNTSDEELLVAAVTDEGAGSFEALYRRYDTEVFRFLARLLGDSALAEDVLQDTFMRVYRGRSRFDPTRRFRPWLYRIARNAAANAVRARKKVKFVKEDAGGEAHKSDRLSRELDGAMAHAQTRGALESLTQEHRTLLLQRHQLGMKLKELAASYDCTERTIRNRLHAAADELARAIVVRRSEGGAQ